MPGFLEVSVLVRGPEGNVLQTVQERNKTWNYTELYHWFTRGSIYYRKYIPQITKPSQYRTVKLQYKFAVSSGSPSNKNNNQRVNNSLTLKTQTLRLIVYFQTGREQCRSRHLYSYSWRTLFLPIFIMKFQLN